MEENRVAPAGFRHATACFFESIYANGRGCFGTMEWRLGLKVSLQQSDREIKYIRCECFREKQTEYLGKKKLGLNQLAPWRETQGEREFEQFSIM